ncbi:MAG TPA: hypothetical protein P5056_03975 [Candidatus Paceibacterota bacterium]|nr:hypothetical protein [Candidatus Paceibacterota bacterium]
MVNIICYCLNPNHFHLILEQVSDNGIREFLRKIGGYSRHFNLKYKRSGPLFQGRFKAKRIDTDDYLLHLSVYVNLNDRVHQLRNPSTKLIENSSWKEYIDDRVKGICKKDYVLDNFKSKDEYKKYAENVLQGIIERKNDLAQLENITLEDY